MCCGYILGDTARFALLMILKLIFAVKYSGSWRFIPGKELFDLIFME